MASNERLTVNFIRNGMRSAVAQTRLSQAKAEVKQKSQVASSTLREIFRVRKSSSNVQEQQKANRQYYAAEDALRSAIGSLDEQKQAAASIEKSHAEAYKRIKAAQQEAGPSPETPFEFHFAETVPALAPSIKRSASKKYKFESAFDGWRREVDEAFEDYSNIETFPSPPGKCSGVRCQAEPGHTCRCTIVEAFRQVDDLQAELKRWHPKNFAVCAADKKKDFQTKAEEIYVVVSEMAQKYKEPPGRATVAMRGPRPSRMLLS